LSPVPKIMTFQQPQSRAPWPLVEPCHSSPTIRPHQLIRIFLLSLTWVMVRDEFHPSQGQLPLYVAINPILTQPFRSFRGPQPFPHIKVQSYTWFSNLFPTFPFPPLAEINPDSRRCGSVLLKTPLFFSTRFSSSLTITLF